MRHVNNIIWDTGLPTEVYIPENLKGASNDIAVMTTGR